MTQGGAAPVRADRRCRDRLPPYRPRADRSGSTPRCGNSRPWACWAGTATTSCSGLPLMMGLSTRPTRCGDRASSTTCAAPANRQWIAARGAAGPLLAWRGDQPGRQCRRRRAQPSSFRLRASNALQPACLAPAECRPIRRRRIVGKARQRASLRAIEVQAATPTGRSSGTVWRRAASVDTHCQQYRVLRERPCRPAWCMPDVAVVGRDGLKRLADVDDRIPRCTGWRSPSSNPACRARPRCRRGCWTAA